MKKYEYKVLQDIYGEESFNLNDINELGKNGWRIMTWKTDDSGYETVLLERVI